MSDLTRARRAAPSAVVAGLLMGLLSLLPLTTRDSLADGAVSKEYQIKAAFLYNFTKFVEWPAASFRGADDSIVVGVYCTEPFAAELEKIVSGRKVNGRALVVKQLETPKDARALHLLFICADHDVLFGAIQSEIQSSPVLTVGESEPVSRHGGVIVFVREDDKVRFEINMGAAERAGLKVSAQLQKLATIVRQAP